MDPLDYPTPDHYLLPQHLFANSSLTKLSLKFCDLAPTMSVCWPSLKGLSIGQTKLSDDVIRTILLGSPALECLKLKGCEGFNHIDITSQNLRKFAIDGFKDSTGGDDVSVLEISGPHLRLLHITGNLYGRKCRLRNVPCLVDVILSFQMAVEDEDHENLYENQREILRELLEVLRHVEELTIGTWCIQVLSLGDVKNLPSPLSTHKCLNTWLPKWDIPGIASLLESSPDLEKIVINRIAGDYLEFDRDLNFSILYNFDEKKYWISQKRIFKCLLFHLKTVEISGAMTAPGRMCERVTSIAQFLLKNARVLRKMVIYKQEYNRRWMDSGSRSQKLLEVAEKLLSFPRSSPDAVILFRN